MKVNIEVTAGPARGRVFSIDQADLFIVGRAKDSKISLPNDPYLSRQHFVLEISPPNCRVTDLGSKNGTFVNGVRYGGRKPDPQVKQALNGTLSVTIQNAEIVVGDTRLKVRVDSANAPSAPAGPAGALHVFAVPSSGAVPRSEAEFKRQAIPISAAAARLATAAPEINYDTKADTVRDESDQAPLSPAKANRADCDQTIMESPPPGDDSDRTILERPDMEDTPSAIPLAAGEELCCAHCGRDVTEEAGTRGRIAGAEYVCHECRANHAFKTKERMVRKAILPSPVSSGPGPKFPASAGMDLSQYESLNYPGYKVVDLLGSGGMGVVYKAVRETDGVIVAIKSLLPNVPVSFENYRIFHREIELTSKLRHPNIVEVLDHGRVKGAYYCVLEFVDGLSLKDYIFQMGGQLTLKQATPLMLDVLSGLAAAHNAKIETRAAGPKMMSGIVHRDLKPENILLRRDAFGWTPKIADFGIAKSFESAGMTDMTIAGVCGTPTYWPREQLTHYRYLHPATDVFSIAAVFFEMLTGQCARPGMQETLVQCHKRSISPQLSDFMRVIGNNPIPPIRTLVPQLPHQIASVIDKALLEVEVPLDEVEMRETLQRLRYPDAAVFRVALTDAFKQANIGV